MSLLDVQISHASDVKDIIEVQLANGKTSFLINKKNYKTWWVLEECKQHLPLESNNRSLIETMTFEEDVQLGNRQIKLRQQFRFNLAKHSPSLDIYNSVRGGWQTLPVLVNEDCSLQSSCRARSVLPPC